MTGSVQIAKLAFVCVDFAYNALDIAKKLLCRRLGILISCIKGTFYAFKIRLVEICDFSSLSLGIFPVAALLVILSLADIFRLLGYCSGICALGILKALFVFGVYFGFAVLFVSFNQLLDFGSFTLVILFCSADSILI